MANALAQPRLSRPPAAPPGRIPSPSAVARARARRDLAARPVARLRVAPPLERFLRATRRHGLAGLGLAFAALFVAGGYTRPLPIPGWTLALPLALLALVAVAWRFSRWSHGRRVPVRLDFALGLVLLDLAYAIVQLSGDRDSHLYPLVYLLAAFFAIAPLPRRATLGLVGACVAADVLRFASTDALLSDWRALSVQVGFMVVFALLYHLVLSAKLSAARAYETHAVERRLRDAEESARSLRLIVADRSRDGLPAEAQEATAGRMLLGAVLEVERAVGSILESAQVALGPHALALYWLSGDDQTIALRDGRCPAGLLQAGPLPAGDGVLGSVLRHAQAIRASGKMGGITWYTRSVPIRAVLAAPVIERTVEGTGYVRGVLVCDRLEAEPFTDRDEQYLVEVAAQIARAAEAERLVGELHQAKDQQDRMQRAAEELNRAATIDEVGRATVKLLRELAGGLDLSALTLVEREGSRTSHRVVAAEGGRASEVDGLVYDDNDGIVAHVVRLGSALPARPPGVFERVKLFDLKLAGLGSLRVVPLVAGGKTLGTLVAGAKARGAVDPEAKRRLEALSPLAAGALARALALAEISRLATIDGLTGLSNRRELDDLAHRAVQEASRYQRPLALVMCDVDHFKKVNDVHGHAVGDEVLKAVAQALEAEAREADVVGRFGGEEFVLVLPNTGAEGARELAERIRRRLESAAVPTTAGPLQVTMSLGVSALPTHGHSFEELTRASDEALYEAKRGGRNRVVLAGLDRPTTPAAG